MTDEQQCQIFQDAVDEWHKDIPESGALHKYYQKFDKLQKEIEQAGFYIKTTYCGQNIVHKIPAPKPTFKEEKIIDLALNAINALTDEIDGFYEGMTIFQKEIYIENSTLSKLAKFYEYIDSIGYHKESNGMPLNRA